MTVKPPPALATISGSNCDRDVYVFTTNSLPIGCADNSAPAMKTQTATTSARFFKSSTETLPAQGERVKAKATILRIVRKSWGFDATSSFQVVTGLVGITALLLAPSGSP